MLAWILEHGGLKPGFLIGGVPENFGVSARLTDTPFFVIEADEYDTAFFDKRSKFVHYRPRTAVLNNLEFDHADIFPDLAAIETQFHHLVRTIPGNGLIVANGADGNLERVLARGCWTPVERFALASGWQAGAQDARALSMCRGKAIRRGALQWDLLGVHNQLNALAAIAAARHGGVPAGGGDRGAGAVQERQAPHGSERRGQRRHGLRRFRASSDRDRDHARGTARARSAVRGLSPCSSRAPTP